MEYLFGLDTEPHRNRHGDITLVGLTELLKPFLDQALIPLYESAKKPVGQIPLGVGSLTYHVKDLGVRFRNDPGKHEEALTVHTELELYELSNRQLQVLESELMAESPWSNCTLDLHNDEWSELIQSADGAANHERFGEIFKLLWQFQENPPCGYTLFVLATSECRLPQQIITRGESGIHAFVFPGKALVQSTFGKSIQSGNEMLGLANRLRAAGTIPP